jgi:zinc/manganese transport system permease protein
VTAIDLPTMWEVMKWPLAACLVLPPLLTYLGMHVVRRGVIFVDLAMAQVASLGTCLALLLGYSLHDRATFWIALTVSFAHAILLSATRNSEKYNVPQEAVVGVPFVFAAAASILLLSKVAGGKDEVQNLLVGDILNVTPRDVLQRAGIFALLAIYYAFFHKKFMLISFDPKGSEAYHVRLWDFLFYAPFAIAIVNFVAVAGVLLTFSYLIVPAVCASMLSEEFVPRLLIGWGIAALASIAGLVASWWLDLPTGAAIVCALGILLAVVGSAVVFRRNYSDPPRRRLNSANSSVRQT